MRQIPYDYYYEDIEGRENRRNPDREFFTCTEEQLSRVLTALDATHAPCARDREVSVLRAFLEQCVNDREGGVLYCQGPPGAGKTLCVNHVVDTLGELVQIDKSHLPIVVRINGMTLRKNDSLFKAIWEQYQL